MFKAELKDLTANDRHNTLTADEIRVVYHVDGADVRDPYFQRFKFSSDGDSEEIGRAHPYDSELAITLYEEDIFIDDEIDQQTITDTSETTDTLTFSDGSAEYELEYEVTDEGSTTAEEIALKDFRDSNVSGAWYAIDKGDITSALDLYATPPADQNSDGTPDVFELDQGRLGYCSNVAVAFSLAWRKPRRFVEAVRAMYEHGRFLSRTETQYIAEDLKRSPVPSGIDPLEWVFTAAIEDSDNWVTIVTNNNTQEGAYNEFEKYWLDEIVGYENASITDDDGGTQDVRNDSNTALNNGGTAILGLDHEMLDTGPNGYLNNPSGKAADQMQMDHAVTLTQNFQTGGGRTQYTVHTWASQLSVNHPATTVNDYLFDTVAGWD